MSPVSQWSLGCTGMRHLEQLGLGTAKTPGAQRDETGGGGCCWRVRLKRGSQGPHHKKG